nr:MAG TPA: hypothetical protein [Caudoviricetes sp.]
MPYLRHIVSANECRTYHVNKQQEDNDDLTGN